MSKSFNISSMIIWTIANKTIKTIKQYFTPVYISNIDFYIVLNYIKIMYNFFIFFIFLVLFFGTYLYGFSLETNGVCLTCKKVLTYKNTNKII